MDRKEQLMQLCAGLDEKAKTATAQLVDEMVFLEERLSGLKAQPFISVNSRNPAQQRQTAAAMQYKELLQQYTNCVKILLKATGGEAVEEESPVRAWMRENLNQK